MARIVCFSDTAAVAYAVQQGLDLNEHDLHVLSASRLTNDTRDQVRDLAPDVILMELTRALDNAHLFFFLRSDQYTRNVPVILLSTSARVDQHSAILGADGYVQNPCDTLQIWESITEHLPLHQARVAA